MTPSARVRWITTACLIALLALACSDEQPRRDILGTEKKLYSQNDEELIIRDFFQDRRDGFFLDVGCYHYKRDSTTYYLEKYLGWSGIAVDANGDFRRGYEAHRPRTRFENYLVTDHSGDDEPFYLLLGGGEGASSASRQWIVDFFESFGSDAKPAIREMSVPAITLNDLLEKNGVERIDFLSMDIEGHEPAALAGFDIERFRPELVCIEAPKDPQKILGYFAAHGYERIDRYLEYDYVNWYFRPVTPPGS